MTQEEPDRITGECGECGQWSGTGTAAQIVRDQIAACVARGHDARLVAYRALVIGPPRPGCGTTISGRW